LKLVCTPDILKYASNLKHATAKITSNTHNNLIYHKIQPTGKTTGPENKSKLVGKSATSEIITKKYTVKQSAKNGEWKTPCMTEYKKRHIHTYHTK
jgi:hypothetical protein